MCSRRDSEELSMLCSQKAVAGGSDSPMITVEDGRVVSLNKYMQELREQGLFDAPSPVPNFNTGTPYEVILARFREKRNENIPASKESNGGSQGTPVGRYLRGLQERNVLPSTPKQTNSANTSVEMSPVRSVFDIKTPETPLGRFLGDENPSKETRKHWQRYINKFPHYKCHDRPPSVLQRRPSTPWSEVKKQAWAWLLRDKNDPSSTDDNNPACEESIPPEMITTAAEGAFEAKTSLTSVVQETESQREVSNQIGQLQDMLKRRNSSGGSRSSLLRLDGATPQKQSGFEAVTKGPQIDAKDSQTDTVGWDEPMETNMTEMSNEFCLRKFMLSAVEQSVRVSCCNTIKSLGGEVSELSHYDNSATHVVCSNPTRNEKILSSMAAGKWIVHVSYVERSGEAGRFLNEELYEFGNPKSVDNLSKLVETTPTIEAMHWWRMKVLQTKQGAFHEMRALVFSKNKPAIVRLIEAGGGVIVQANAPFTHSLDVTHCFIDVKLKLDLDEFIPLAEQGIRCLNVLYLSNFLNNQMNINVNDFIIPTMRDYYK